MARAGLSTQLVIERAAQLMQEHPDTELTLAAVADSFGVRAPTLYKHVEGLTGLRRGVMLRAKLELAEALARATIGRSRGPAVHHLAAAYRNWALAHPAQYPMTVLAPVEGDEADGAASKAALDVVYAVLAGFDLHEQDAVHATRLLRSVLHGFVSLEGGGGFALPTDLEVSYRRSLDSLVAALQDWERP